MEEKYLASFKKQSRYLLSFVTLFCVLTGLSLIINYEVIIHNTFVTKLKPLDRVCHTIVALNVIWILFSILSFIFVRKFQKWS